MRIVETLGPALEATRALRLGFAAENSFDEIIRVHIDDELGDALRAEAATGSKAPAIHVRSRVVPPVLRCRIGLQHKLITRLARVANNPAADPSPAPRSFTRGPSCGLDLRAHRGDDGALAMIGSRSTTTSPAPP
jgi:hypothetical protein